MPWEEFAHLTYQELEGTYLYLRSMPALENALK